MKTSKKQIYSTIVITLFVIAIPLANFNHHKYETDEGVIVWDVKSYYAYLPATFIYKDLSLEFVKNNSDKSIDLKKWIWYIKTPTGKRGILTTMGLSIMYAPFFFIGHAFALALPQYEATGYSLPYHVALQFSTYIYFLLSLIVLRKILRKYFNDKVIAITLFALGAGTNLFFYVVYDAPMSHGYSFFLIVLFIYFLEKWTTKVKPSTTIILGLVSGLIALIRPTNIIILILIPLWHVGSWEDFKERIRVLIGDWKFIVLMAFCFLLVWIPQLAYWKYISDSFFYFSYGERGDQFFFNNPQIWNILFSYEKGWFVYTPLMLLAFIGFVYLKKKRIGLVIPILSYVAIMVYVLSSWWSWWYGGAFGQRSMVDFYGLMAFPLAALIESGLKKKFVRYLLLMVLLTLISFNQFNIKQYRNMAISYWWMNKESYWTNFLKLHPTCKYWNVVMHPNYEKARQGIYEPIAPYNKSQVVTDSMLVQRIVIDNKNNKLLLDSLKRNKKDYTDSTLVMNYAKEIVKNNQAGRYFKAIKIDYYKKQIKKCPSWKKEVEKKANKRATNFEKMVEIEAERVYTNYSQKYDQR